MSHIHDALKKAQDEKDSLYGHYGEIISPSGNRKALGGGTWKAGAAIVVIFLAIALFALLQYEAFSPEKEKREPKAESAASQTATVPRKPVPVVKPRVREPTIEGWYREALARQQKNDLQKAEEIYKKILRVNADYAPAINNLSVIYMAQQKNTEAKAGFERAIQLKIDYADPYYNLACLYAKGENIPESLKYLALAIRYNEKARDWAKSDGDLQRLRGSKDFEQLVGISPGE